MKILICSDGHSSAENAVRFISPTAAACAAQVTLLGIVEHPADEPRLTKALQHSAQILRDDKAAVEIVMRHGLPIDQIHRIARETLYDLVVVGAVRKASGSFTLSAKAYHIIKGIDPPVLVMIGDHRSLRRVLICSGARPSMLQTIKLTGELAKCSNATVTLIHVMPKPPLLYAGLLQEEIGDVEKLLASDFSLAQKLRAEKAAFEELDVKTDVKLRCGEVAEELLRENREGGYDLIVAGSALSGGVIRTYVMGDITAEIVNKAEGAVLIVRNAMPEPDVGAPGPLGTVSRFVNWLKSGFSGSRAKSDQ